MVAAVLPITMTIIVASRIKAMWDAVRIPSNADLSGLGDLPSCPYLTHVYSSLSLNHLILF